jgi:hypothetical protein
MCVYSDIIVVMVWHNFGNCVNDARLKADYKESGYIGNFSF